jgi:branched-chain amino acid transport system ATP-binding protein
MADHALELRELSVRYGAVDAVRGLSLVAERGEVVGLIGPNGAGKSSTLHAIMGVVRPAGGEILVNGTSVRGRRPEAVARSGVALVPEGRRIFSGLAGRGSRTLNGGGVRGDLAWVYELFPIVHEFRKRQAGVLSGGQQQQLAIARALVARPEVLLLDEPSLGLAPTLVDAVFGALGAIRERGVTSLLVEQRAQRTVAFADRTYLIANGELRLTLTPKDADDTTTMVAAYLS